MGTLILGVIRDLAGVFEDSSCMIGQQKDILFVYWYFEMNISLYLYALCEEFFPVIGKIFHDICYFPFFHATEIIF